LANWHSWPVHSGSLRTLLEGILTRFTAVSQGAIYLRDFFEFFEIVPKIKMASKCAAIP
jgi:ATP-binding cassette subfamily B protein